MEAWQDLATIYADVSAFLDAKACVDKAKLIEFFSPRSWHITGMELGTFVQVFLYMNYCMFLHFAFTDTITPCIK